MTEQPSADQLAPVIPLRRGYEPEPTPTDPAQPGRRATMDDRRIEALYVRHGASVHRYIRSLTFGDAHLAEDITQETFLRAWRNPQLNTDTPEACRGWLTTVARNLVIDRLRERRRRPQEAGAEALPMAAEPASDIDRMLTSVTVRDALARLSPAHRHILVELYLRERTLAEFAEATGIPVGTVKSRAHYALRALRRELEQPTQTPDRRAA